MKFKVNHVSVFEGTEQNVPVQDLSVDRVIDFQLHQVMAAWAQIDTAKVSIVIKFTDSVDTPPFQRICGERGNEVDLWCRCDYIQGSVFGDSDEEQFTQRITHRSDYLVRITFETPTVAAKFVKMLEAVNHPYQQRRSA